MHRNPAADALASFAGLPTFLNLPSADGPAGLDIDLVSVPMDLGVSNRQDARFGPRLQGGADSRGARPIGDLSFRSRLSLEQSIEDIEVYYSALCSQGARPCRWVAITR